MKKIIGLCLLALVSCMPAAKFDDEYMLLPPTGPEHMSHDWVKSWFLCSESDDDKTTLQLEGSKETNVRISLMGTVSNVIESISGHRATVFVLPTFMSFAVPKIQLTSISNVSLEDGMKLNKGDIIVVSGTLYMIDCNAQIMNIDALYLQRVKYVPEY